MQYMINKMKKKQVYIALMIFICFGFDQYTKKIVRLQIEPQIETIHSQLPGNYKFNSKTEIFGKQLQLMNVENEGAFLGMGSELNPSIKIILLLILPITVLLFVLYYLFTDKSLNTMSITGLSLIVGGGFANLYDRYKYGSVTDFLYMEFSENIKTGIFNFADMCVTTGMILILIASFTEKYQKKAD